MLWQQPLLMHSQRFMHSQRHRALQQCGWGELQYHAPLVVEALLEVPQPAAPEVVGALAQEGRQFGFKQALDVRMPSLPKHGPNILIFQLPAGQTAHILQAVDAHKSLAQLLQQLQQAF